MEHVRRPFPDPPQTRGECRVTLTFVDSLSETELSNVVSVKLRSPQEVPPMQATNGIQNAMINTNAGAQGGMVVDAANAHRSYLRDERPCEVRPVSKRPSLGVLSSQSSSDGAIDLKRRLPSEADGRDGENAPQSMCSGRTWRFDDRHLPEAAWAMLILNRSLCG